MYNGRMVHSCGSRFRFGGIPRVGGISGNEFGLATELIVQLAQLALVRYPFRSCIFAWPPPEPCVVGICREIGKSENRVRLRKVRTSILSSRATISESMASARSFASLATTGARISGISGISGSDFCAYAYVLGRDCSRHLRGFSETPQDDGVAKSPKIDVANPPKLEKLVTDSRGR